MNTFFKSILAILGGFDVVFSLALPILVAVMWVIVSPVKSWTWVVVLIAILSSMFRAFKFAIGGSNE